MGRTPSTFAVLLLAIPAFARNAASTAVIWNDRGDAAALDLSSGPGGKDREPGTEFKLVKESVSGTSRFNSSNWESGLGGGLQYRHSRSIAARVEMGRGRERTAIYASLSRGF